MDENDLLNKFREILNQDKDNLPKDSEVTTANDPTLPEKRTYSYYQKMKEKNPKLYLDRKTALQMDRDSQKLGAAFFDTE